MTQAQGRIRGSVLHVQVKQENQYGYDKFDKVLTADEALAWAAYVQTGPTGNGSFANTGTTYLPLSTSQNSEGISVSIPGSSYVLGTVGICGALGDDIEDDDDEDDYDDDPETQSYAESCAKGKSVVVINGFRITIEKIA